MADNLHAVWQSGQRFSSSAPNGTSNAHIGNSGVEDYELADNRELREHSNYAYRKRATYKDGSSIDWLHEEASERERDHVLRSRPGVKGLLHPILDVARMWFVVVATGVGIGLAGAWLDILVKWLGDLREGRCSYGFFYNQTACCSGLDAGEVCTVWKTWSQWFNIQSILGQSLLQSSVYVVLAVAFAGSAAVLVVTYAPYAFHTGIPEIKVILGGYVLDSFLTPWTLLIKALGLALAVASGLSLGKEGPLVHVACCMANLLSSIFEQFRHNEAQRRKLLAAAAAAGVSVAFGSPLGGVLFGLEELDTFANESEVMWRGFVASAIAAVALQYVDPFSTSKLVLFQVTGVQDTWRAFELIPWVGLGILGGVLGSLFIKLNVNAAVYRRRTILNDYPVTEVLGFSAFTAAISYLIVFARVQSSELVANLFQECDASKGDYHGLCNPNAMWENVFLLLLTAGVKIGLTAWTFGMMVPAGIFLPTITIGACLGRAVGLLTQGLQRTFPTVWLFSSCPPDPTVRCIQPGFYAVIGASAMLGGVTRMTVSLVVILFELTGALSHVLPIMICVMISKWVGDALGTDGIYPVWIAMRSYPWLRPIEYHDQGQTGAQIMKRVEHLVVIEDERCTLQELSDLVEEYQYNGFPIVRDQLLNGYVTREKLKAAIEFPLSQDKETGVSRFCVFTTTPAVYRPAAQQINLTGVLEQSVLQLRKEVPLELIVTMFQKLNIRQILFTHAGKLIGMVTKSDVVSLLTAHFPHNAALSSNLPEN